MDASVIRCRLDLLVRLIDTTTGAEIEERNVQFFRDHKPVQPVPRGNGNYVFLNCGREDGSLDIKVWGFDPCQVSVEYEKLDSQVPVLEAFLIPSESAASLSPVITYSGKLPGLESVQAVNLGQAYCCISEFDERKRIMKLFKTHRSGMDHVYYGLIHPERQDYEPFTVVKEISESSIKISQPLKEPFSVNSPIARIVFGRVTPEGDYVLRVRNDASRLLYLVRYVTEGDVSFQVVDFHRLEEKEQTVWRKS